MKIRIYLLIAALAFLSFARFYKLDAGSYWLDEIVTVENAQRGFSKAWTARTHDYNPPGYDLLLVPIIKMWGPMEVEGRFLSALAGSLSLAVLFLSFGFRRFWPGFFAVLAAGLSYPHYHYSREARPYIFIFIFSLVALLQVQKTMGAQKEWTFKNFGILTFLLTLGNFFHYSGVIFTASFFMAIFAFRKHLNLKLKQILALGLLQTVLYLPWMSVLLEHSRAHPGWLGNSPAQILKGLSDLSDFYLGHSYLGPFILIFLAAVLLWAFHSQHEDRWTLAFMNSLWILPVALTFFVLIFLTPGRVVERHLIEMYPGLLLSLFLSFALVFQKIPKLSSLLAGAFLFYQVYNLFRSPLLDNLHQFQDRRVSEYVAQLGSPCKLILTDGFSISQTFYFQRIPVQFDYKIYESMNVNMKDFASETCPWVVYLKTRFFYSTRPDLAKYLETDFEIKSSRNFPHTEVLLLERRTK